MFEDPTVPVGRKLLGMGSHLITLRCTKGDEKTYALAVATACQTETDQSRRLEYVRQLKDLVRKTAPAEAGPLVYQTNVNEFGMAFPRLYNLAYGTSPPVETKWTDAEKGSWSETIRHAALQSKECKVIVPTALVRVRCELRWTPSLWMATCCPAYKLSDLALSLIHISEPTRPY